MHRQIERLLPVAGPFSICVMLFLAFPIFAQMEVASPGVDEKGVAGVEFETEWIASDRRLSEQEIRSGLPGIRRGDIGGIETRDQFLYVWVTFHNPAPVDIDVILHDHSRNYYTELLERKPDGLVRLYRHGDIVAPSEYAIRHHRTAFPLTLPAKSDSEYVIEYMGPKGIHTELQISEPNEYIDIAATDRAIGGIIAGVFLSLILFNLLSGIIERSTPIVSIAAFTGSIFYFHLRQSRMLLLLIDPWIYPEWLYPLTITSNIVFASLLGFQLLRKYLHRVEIAAILGITGLSIVGAGVSGITYPYLVADILNLLALLILGIFLLSIYRGIRSRDRRVVWITASFVPWICAVIFDILLSWNGIKTVGVLQHLQVFGLLIHLVILTIALQVFRVTREKQRGSTYSHTNPLPLAATGKTYMEASHRIRAKMIQKTAKDLRTPLDALISTTDMLIREATDPRLTAALSMIDEDARKLKRMIGESFSTTSSETDVGVDVVDVEERESRDQPVQPLVARMDARIWIYGREGDATRYVLRILSPYGYTLRVESNRYAVLQAAQQDEIDVLVVDPADPELQAFTLCGLIRSEQNMLQLPILMITEPFADQEIDRGYASGANDFIARPLDANELSSRILSLVRLKQVVRHNTDLAQSEEEKNTFLYFLTHNVNTPLTIIMNRVRDLENLMTLDDLDEIVEDLTNSTDEINSIVRNVLISFRLADGRQVIRPERINVGEILETLSRDFSRRVSEKNQSISMHIPEEVPTVSGDRIAVRAVLFNLIDNAVKFSPLGGEIRITVTVAEYLSVLIEDSGPGIPEDDLPQLFGRFCRLTPQPTGDESSTGLGLHVASELARMNGGEVEYRAGDPGSIFIFRLPLQK